MRTNTMLSFSTSEKQDYEYLLDRYQHGRSIAIIEGYRPCDPFRLSGRKGDYIIDRGNVIEVNGPPDPHQYGYPTYMKWEGGMIFDRNLSFSYDIDMDAQISDIIPYTSRSSSPFWQFFSYTGDNPFPPYICLFALNRPPCHDIDHQYVLEANYYHEDKTYMTMSDQFVAGCTKIDIYERTPDYEDYGLTRAMLAGALQPYEHAEFVDPRTMSWEEFKAKTDNYTIIQMRSLYPHYLITPTPEFHRALVYYDTMEAYCDNGSPMISNVKVWRFIARTSPPSEADDYICYGDIYEEEWYDMRDLARSLLTNGRMILPNGSEVNPLSMRQLLHTLSWYRDDHNLIPLIRRAYANYEDRYIAEIICRGGELTDIPYILYPGIFKYLEGEHYGGESPSFSDQDIIDSLLESYEQAEYLTQEQVVEKIRSRLR